MRSQSVQIKETQPPQAYDGFTSDYYSYHTLEKRNKNISRKYTFSSHNDECLNDKEILRHYKRIFCLPVGSQFELTNIVNELKTFLNYDNDKDKDKDEGNNKDNYKDKGKGIIIEQVKSVIILKFPNKDKLIFIFDFGVIVMWSFDINEEHEISNIFFNNCKFIINAKFNPNLNLVKKENENSHTPTQDDNCNIFYFRKGEVFNISNRNKISMESDNLNEILSVTYALAQHTVLSHYETEVANTIEETKRIPIEMRDKGQINLPKKEMSRHIGLIFMRRSAVNLNSGIIDTPDLFWEQKAEVEVYYSLVRKYLEIDKRVEVLDRRMKILKELYDVMNNDIKTQGKFRLEWIVVYLIVIEIFVSVFWKMLVKDILKLY